MNRSFLTALMLVASFSSLNANVYHVAKTGSDTNPGTAQHPYLTISKAAFVAIAGDSVIIHEGVYRERVSPANSGISPLRRIVYMSAPGEEVWLKGSEVITQWKKNKDGTWIAELPNALFGEFNPFAITLFGDWLSKGKDLHLGDVYLGGRALREAQHPEDMNHSGRWTALVDDENTTIHVNFGNEDPTKSLVEINVRPTCFFPKTTGINYITVKGLHIAQAATQWSPPTGEQVGIIGPNWSKGWIIEDCEVMQSKAVGICLGKERASGHNMWTLYHRKDFGYNKSGFNREIEAVFKAYDLGWNRSNIGSHLVQNNVIHDCGQAGIVGHMGSIFSTIRNNEIYDINRGGQIAGAETAGIKLHAAIDVRLEHNLIKNTTMGIWLDWQAQGAHVVGNVIAESDKQDLFFEVTHGPTLVYNNILLSRLGILFRGGQGMAVFNNLISGGVKAGASKERYTPYHYPHSTKIKGLFNNTGGDIRFYNNIFLGNATETPNLNGLSSFNGYPVYDPKMGDTVRSTVKSIYFKFPIWTYGNLYYKNGNPYKGETDYVQEENELTAELEKKEDGYYLSFDYENTTLKQVETLSIHTEMLGQTFISEAIFDNPDRTWFLFEKDFFGNARNTERPVVGPFEKPMKNRIKVF